MPRAENEYGVQLWGDVWRVHKFDGHHGSHRGWYEVRLVGDDWLCNCPRVHGCKHARMVDERMAEMLGEKR